MIEKIFALKVAEIVSYNKELSACQREFENNIKQLLKLKELTAPANWYMLTYADFAKKALYPATLSPQQQAAAEKLFNEAAKEALKLKTLVDETDKLILRMVHDQMEEQAREAAGERETLSEMQQQRAGVFKGKAVSEKKVKG